MAQRRMFSLRVVDTDRFLDLPSSSQSLYFHLGMRADDEGFVSSPRKITTLVGSAPDDLKLLIAKGFVIPFESGVCVITDWRVNCSKRYDRFSETQYENEKSLLFVTKQGSYTTDANLGLPLVLPNDVPQGVPVVDPNKIKDNLKKNMGAKPPPTPRFVPPSVEEVAGYCRERGNCVDAEKFVDFYASKGWVVGKAKMRDWRAAVRTWERESQTAAKSTAGAEWRTL